MSDLVGNPEDRFSRDVAHFMSQIDYARLTESSLLRVCWSTDNRGEREVENVCGHTLIRYLEYIAALTYTSD